MQKVELVMIKDWIKFAISEILITSSGEQRYSISEGIKEALTNTSIDKIYGNEVNFPYKTFSIQLDIPIRDNVVIYSAVVSEIFGAFSISLHIAPVNGFGLFCSADILVRKEEKIIDCIEKSFEENKDFIKDHRIKDACRLVVNMILYVTSMKPDTLEYTGVKKGKKNFSSYSKSNITVIGGSYKFRSMYKNAGTGNGSSKCKHMVSGHWRNQPCGEGLKDIKKIWIEPFIKGANKDGELKRTYKVK